MSGENAEEALCMRGTIVVISNRGQVVIEGDHFVGETCETRAIREEGSGRAKVSAGEKSFSCRALNGREKLKRDSSVQNDGLVFGASSEIVA